MTEREILIAASGISETREPKAQVQIDTKFVDVENGEEIVLDTIGFHGPILNFFRSVRHMNMDVQFDSASDPGLLQLVQILKNFCVPENSLSTGDSRIPIITVTALPTSLGGEYFATGVNASWVVMPSQANRLPDTVRFIFDNRDFHTYRLNESEVDFDQLEREQ